MCMPPIRCLLTKSKISELWTATSAATNSGDITEVHPVGAAASLTRLLAGCRVDPLDEAAAKAAGILLGKCSMNPGAVDASVAEGALRRGDAVVTGNASHLRALADGGGRKLEVIPV
jgi:predicted nucleic acid-binding protein